MFNLLIFKCSNAHAIQSVVCLCNHSILILSTSLSVAAVILRSLGLQILLLCRKLRPSSHFTSPTMETRMSLFIRHTALTGLSWTWRIMGLLIYMLVMVLQELWHVNSMKTRTQSGLISLPLGRLLIRRQDQGSS